MSGLNLSLVLSGRTSFAVNGSVPIFANGIVKAAPGNLKLTSVLQRTDNQIIEFYAE